MKPILYLRLEKALDVGYSSPASGDDVLRKESLEKKKRRKKRFLLKRHLPDNK